MVWATLVPPASNPDGPYAMDGTPASVVNEAPPAVEAGELSVTTNIGRRREHKLDDRLAFGNLERHHGIRPPVEFDRMLVEPVILRRFALNPLPSFLPYL
jgi:hypothetical protein